MNKIFIRQLVLIGFLLLLSSCQQGELTFDYYIEDLQKQTTYEIIDELAVTKFQKSLETALPLSDTVSKEMQYIIHFKKKEVYLHLEEPYLIFEYDEELFISEDVDAFKNLLNEAIVYTKNPSTP